MFEIIKTQLNKNKIQSVDKTCSICMEDVIDGDNNVITLSCGHRLRESCFRKNYIIHVNNKCPLCRKPLTKEDAEIKLNTISKLKYWKYIKHEIDNAADYEHELITRYKFYKNIGLMFEPLTKLYTLNIKATQMNKPRTMYTIRTGDFLMTYYFTRRI